jgi:benzoylformate decarboxylase
MADAFARITRRPAFVEVHIAPGLGNALGMLHNAAIGKTPLVVYAGQSPGRTLLQEPHLSGPLVEMAKPVCKWAAQIHHAHDMPRALRRAFKVAMEPPQGPVFLSVPMDTLDEEAEVDIRPTTYTNWRGRADAAGMAEVARILVAARRPMLMVGDGVALADAQPEVVALAELAGVPIFECYASEFTAPASHPLNLGALNFVTPGPLKAALDGCDLLLVVGAPMFQLIFPDVESPIPTDTKVVQIDVNPWEVGKNLTPDLAFLADPKAALAELAEQVRRHRTPEQARAAAERAQTIGEQTKAARARYWEGAKAGWDASPITAPRLMHEIRQALPDNALGAWSGSAAAASAPACPARWVRRSRGPTARSWASAPTARPCTRSQRCGRPPITSCRSPT